MEPSVYFNIVTLIRQYQGFSSDCMEFISKKFPDLSSDTVYSIVYFEYQKRMKVNHSKAPSIINKYWDMYCAAIKENEKPGIILRIARDYEVCPCLVAKLILQKYFHNDNCEGHFKTNPYLRDTTLIPEPRLAYEVFLCTMYDNLYSGIAETMKHSWGQEYEIKLYNEVAKLNLAFRDEVHLRKCGYDKTPDIKLDVPIAIDGNVINWIESKALFGGIEVHQEYIKNQYSSYWNRFGPGLVIYWFGYNKALNDIEEKQFIVRDHLPKDVIHIK